MMLRALLTIGAVQLLTMLVLLARTKTLAVVLGPELVGVMAVVEKLVALVAQSACLSLPFAAVRFLPARWTEGPAEYRELFTRMRNVLLLTAALVTIVATAVASGAPAAAGAALLPYREVVLAAALGIPVAVLLPFMQNAIAGRMQQYRSSTVGFLQAVAAAAAIVGVFAGGLAGYYVAYAVLGLVVVGIASRLATAGTPPPASPGALALPPSIWRFAGALFALAVLAPYAALYAHYRVLDEHGAQAAGWMQAAIGISLAVRAVLGSSHAIFLTPNVNRGGSRPDRMAWANAFQGTLCLVAGVLVPPLLLAPELVVHVLYSAQFEPGAGFVMLFVLVEVLGMLSGTYQVLIVAFDHLRFHVASNLAAQGAVVALAFALVGPLGILGAALAALAAPVLLFAATLAFLHRAHGLAMPRALAARLGWLLAALIASGIIGVAMPGWSAGALAMKLATYAAILAGFIPLLDAHERSRFRQGYENLRNRAR